MNKKRTKLISFIAILTLIGGILTLIKSFPSFSLYYSIKQGGIGVINGIKIIEVSTNSPASEKGLIKDDIILSVNGKKINRVPDFIKITNDNQGKQMTLFISRNGVTNSISIIPRTNPPLNQGKLGIEIKEDYRVEKMPTYLLIPEAIIKGYSGYEIDNSYLFPKYTGFIVIEDKSYSRLKALFWGITGITIAIGIYKLKKLAMYGYLLIYLYTLIEGVLNIPTLILKQSNTIGSPLFFAQSGISNFEIIIYIFIIILESYFAFYIYNNRKRFI